MAVQFWWFSIWIGMYMGITDQFPLPLDCMYVEFNQYWFVYLGNYQVMDYAQTPE